MSSALNWFEIPVTDIARAQKFYSTVLGITFTAGPGMGGYQMAMFPAPDGIGGALIQGEGEVPSIDGTIVYLACDPDLAIPLSRVEAAGGKILVPKTSIGENGNFAYILDTEGNKVGLHSMG
jgi:hypothetical protein